MRYLLPALAAGYLIAADVAARIILKLKSRLKQLALLGVVSGICLGNLGLVCLPDLTKRNDGTLNAVRLSIQTVKSLPADSVFLAYTLADTFILYGRASVLNYRRVESPDLHTRNQIVIHAIDQLLCINKPVYLVQDDQFLFNSIYGDLEREFALQAIDTPIKSFRITHNAPGRCQEFSSV